MPEATITAKNAAQQAFIPVMRELVRAYQAFETFDANAIREHDLTPAQADVIFTLGNTEGMVFKEIGEFTLITKGTLTGVVDRLEQKALVKRQVCETDRRRMYVRLTTKGEKIFNKAFPSHIARLKQRFAGLSRTEMKQAETILKKIRQLF